MKMTKWIIVLAIYCFSVSGILAKTYQEYFDQIRKVEIEVLSLEINREYEQQAEGDLETIFSLYLDEASTIENEFQNDELSELEKHTLKVYLDNVVAGQILSTRYRTIDNDTTKSDFLAGRLKILEESRLNREDDLVADPNEEDIKLQSFVKALYAENLYNIIEIDPLGTISYSAELEREAARAIKLDSKNQRAYLILAIYHITIANLSPLNLEKGRRYLDKVRELLKENPNPVNQFYLSLWQSQMDLSRFDKASAEQSLKQAKAIYPKAGILRYATSLLAVNRLLSQGLGGMADEGEDENEDKVNFNYEYSIDYQDYFLYQNYFNFIYDDFSIAPYIGVGNNFSPFAFYLEAGTRVKWSDFVSKLLFKHKNSFLPELDETYSGEFQFGWNRWGVDIGSRTDFGQMWKYRYNGEKNYYEYDAATILEQELGIGYLIWNGAYNDFYTKLKGTYSYAPNEKENLWNVDYYVKMNLLKTGWGQFKVKSELSIADQFQSAGHTGNNILLNRLNFYSKSPFPLYAFTKGNQFYPTDLVGRWFFVNSITYQFYPFYFLDSVSAVKSIFIAPSAFFGWIGNTLGDTQNKFSYSALGNIGFTFPGGTSISLGLGWNESDEWLINLLSY